MAFSADLMRSSVVEADAQFFSKDRFFLSLGNGTATMAYRPILRRHIDRDEDRHRAHGRRRAGVVAGGKDIEPLPVTPVACTDSNNTLPEGCQPRRDDFCPRSKSSTSVARAWLRLPRMSSDTAYTLLNPERYTDPTTGQVLVRSVNDNPELQAGFGFQLVLEGDVE